MQICNVRPHEPDPETRPKHPNPEPKVQRCTLADNVQNRTLRQPAIVRVQPRRASPSLPNTRRCRDFNHDNAARSTQINTTRNSINRGHTRCNTSIFWTTPRKTIPPPARPSTPRCPTQPQAARTAWSWTRRAPMGFMRLFVRCCRVDGGWGRGWKPRLRWMRAPGTG